MGMDMDERRAGMGRRLKQDEPQRLGNELDIAEHRPAAELADDRASFIDAVEAELRGWDISLERMQTRAAMQNGADRAMREDAIAEVRRHRTAAADRLTEVRAAGDHDWRDVKKRMLAALDNLERRAHTAHNDKEEPWNMTAT
jgi:hypothetical protein